MHGREREREVRYAVAAAASTHPTVALQWVLSAEAWSGDVAELPMVTVFETLGAKFGKALRRIVKGDNKRELQVLEERILREKKALIDGRQIYAWILAKFACDARLARPQILQEIASCRIGAGKGALTNWINRWDATVERLVQTGTTSEGDKEILYLHFKPSFMACSELSGSADRIKTSLPGSKVHSYEWTYKSAKARFETLRLEEQETERLAASQPTALHPITPGFGRTQKPDGRGKDNGKTNFKDLACPRLSSGKGCNFGDTCWYSHAPAVVRKAQDKQKAEPKAKAKGKAGSAGANSGGGANAATSTRTCMFYQRGKCKKGDECNYRHDLKDAAATTATVAISTPCLALAAPALPESQPMPTSSGDDGAGGGKAPSLNDVLASHIINGHMPPMRDSCPISRSAQLLEAPERRKGGKAHVEDVRVPYGKFGDAVYCDILHLARGKNGELKESDGVEPTLKWGLTLHVWQTSDI